MSSGSDPAPSPGSGTADTISSAPTCCLGPSYAPHHDTAPRPPGAPARPEISLAPSAPSPPTHCCLVLMGTHGHLHTVARWLCPECNRPHHPSDLNPLAPPKNTHSPCLEPRGPLGLADLLTPHFDPCPGPVSLTASVPVFLDSPAILAPGGRGPPVLRRPLHRAGQALARCWVHASWQAAP